MILDVVVYAIYVAILVAAAVEDLRTVRISNKLVLAIALLWLAWHVIRDLLARLMPDAPFVQGAFAVSAANGVQAALIFGIGLFVFTLIYEAITHKYSMGGGDVKLMTVSALFLGLQRSVFALLIACVVSIFIALIHPSIYGLKLRANVSRETNCSEGDEGNSDKGGKNNSSQSRNLATSDVSRETISGSVPFGPGIAIGSAVALFL